MTLEADGGCLSFFGVLQGKTILHIREQVRNNEFPQWKRKHNVIPQSGQMLLTLLYNACVSIQPGQKATFTCKQWCNCAVHAKYTRFRNNWWIDKLMKTSLLVTRHERRTNWVNSQFGLPHKKFLFSTCVTLILYGVWIENRYKVEQSKICKIHQLALIILCVPTNSNIVRFEH